MDILNLKETVTQLEAVGDRLLEKSIQQFGAELKSTIGEASDKIEQNVSLLSQEIHNHRSMTREEIRVLIDYSAEKFGAMIDQRVALARAEVSDLISEKSDKLKEELAEAAKSSRRTMYGNAAISCGAAAVVALVSILYRRAAAVALDPYMVFRIVMLCGAAASLALGLLKAWQRWRAMTPARKGVATVALGYIGLLRPNGAAGMFGLCFVFLACWAGLQYYLA